MPENCAPKPVKLTREMVAKKNQFDAAVGTLEAEKSKLQAAYQTELESFANDGKKPLVSGKPPKTNIHKRPRKK